MAKLGSLREYQDEVLRKMDIARLGNLSDQSMYFGFISGGKNFLIDASLIVEMTPTSKVAPIPLAKPWVEGAANIRGSVYTVTDFSVLLGQDRTRPGSGKFIVFSDDLMAGAALHIDSLGGLFQKDRVSVMNVQSGSETLPGWIIAESIIDDKKYYLISGDLLSGDTRFSKLQIGE